MITKLLISAGLGAICLSSAFATEFNFTYSDGSGDSGSGLIYAVYDGGGVYTALSGYIDYTDPSGSGAYDLVPGSDFNQSDATYDNLLYVANGDAGGGYLDGYGLLFHTTLPQITIWDSQAYSFGPQAGTDYTYYDQGAPGGDRTNNPSWSSSPGNGNFALSTVPGPAAVLPFALGLLRRRRARGA